MARPAPGGAPAARPHSALPRTLRLLAALVLLLYPLAAGALLLTSDGWAVNRLNVRVWYAVTGAVGLREQITPEMFAALANVALFVPFFAALAVLVPTWWWVAAGAGLSIAVELYQGEIGTREQDLVDILANTAGAALGVGLGLLVCRVAVRRSARRPGLSDAGSAPSAPTTPGAPRAETGHGPGGGPDDRD
ncbi:VanZ family protein [Brachybacterium paraconglomeratum]|uniref:VanZ family protein n=1 Tax=Brachybacterium sp. GU-2 TaxID=3069708 RepID=UPI00280AEED3|nr:VanZ family protein [Brachybacterium sp. GU-2]WME22995.1 VanZ family protein [Brachybacterium sp. GU-2]